MTGYLNLQLPKYGDPQQQARFFEEALTRIRALPGVASAAVSNSVPLTEMNDSGSVLIEGRTYQRGGSSPPSANRPHVSAGYFETMGIPLVQERNSIPGTRRSPSRCHRQRGCSGTILAEPERDREEIEYRVGRGEATVAGGCWCGSHDEALRAGGEPAT